MRVHSDTDLVAKTFQGLYLDVIMDQLLLSSLQSP